MKITSANSELYDKETIRKELLAIIDQPTPAQLPPCPNCNQHIADQCSPDCTRVSTALSSDPLNHPIEDKVVPLVFELAASRVMQTCWSCEGHTDDEGKLWRIPQISFYTSSPIYPQLLLKYIGKLVSSKQLNYPWHVVVSDYGPLNGVTYSLEPKLNFEADPHLGKLQQDIKTVSTNLVVNLKAIANNMLNQL